MAAAARRADSEIAGTAAMLCGRCAWQERGPTEWEPGRGCFIAGGRAVASLVSSTVDGIDSDVAASTTEGDAEEYAMPMRLWDDHFPLAAFAAVSWDATRTTEEGWLFMSWNGHKQTRILYKAVRIRKMTVFI